MQKNYIIYTLKIFIEWVYVNPLKPTCVCLWVQGQWSRFSPCIHNFLIQRLLCDPTKYIKNTSKIRILALFFCLLFLLFFLPPTSTPLLWPQATTPTEKSLQYFTSLFHPPPHKSPNHLF